MALQIRRKAGGPGVSIDNDRCTVRVIRVDPDGTVHLSFAASRDVSILREEKLTNPSGRYSRGESNG